MKILVIANFVVFPWEGGNNRFIYLSNMINHKKNKVELITSNFFHSKKKHRDLKENKLNYQITLLDEPGYKKNVCLKRFYSHYVLSQNLKKYLKNMQSRPDIIYCAVPSLDVAFVAAKYCHNKNIKFIIDVQDLWPEAFKLVFNVPIISNIIFYPMIRKANYVYSSADDIVAVSETYANRAASVNKKYNKKLSIFLGTNLNEIDNIPKIKRLDKEIIIVYIGTLGHSYNLCDTIRAIKILNDNGIKDIKFKIMGDGPLIENFKACAKENNINCEFTGRLPYNKMIQELFNCDIAVNPIMNGAAGSIINKVGDYAAVGIPVINTQECIEYRELVEKNNIGLNCTNDPNDIADKIKTLICDEKLRKIMGKNNRKLAEDKFDRDKTYWEIIKLMNKNL